MGRASSPILRFNLIVSSFSLFISVVWLLVLSFRHLVQQIQIVVKGLDDFSISDLLVDLVDVLVEPVVNIT